MAERKYPLSEKIIYFLGSSVTRGHGGDTDGYSFVEVLEKNESLHCYKNAVSGTTLFQKTAGDNSYVSRLAQFDFSKKPHALVVQLSTNDFAQGIDHAKVTGAIETILATVQALSPTTKVILYTCPLRHSVGFYEDYKNYIQNELQELSNRWRYLTVLDLFTVYRNEGGDYFQADGLHPTREGYEKLFAPAFIKVLQEI